MFANNFKEERKHSIFKEIFEIINAKPIYLYVSDILI